MTIVDVIKGVFTIAGGISAIVSIFTYFKIKPMTLMKVAKSTYGLICIISLIICLILYSIDWKKLHYGGPQIVHKEKIVKMKTINPTTKGDSISPIRPKNVTEVILRKPTRIANQNKQVIKQLLIKRPDTTSKPTQFSIPNATFNGPTQLGNNNTMNVEPSLKQRRLNNESFQFIVSHISTKETPIIIALSGGNEAFVFANDMVSKLNANGYSNVKMVNWRDPDPSKINRFEVEQLANSTNIYIYPAGNNLTN